MKIELFFLIAVGLCMISSFIGLIEHIGVQQLKKFFYPLGLKVYHKLEDLPRPSLTNFQKKAFEMDEGMFKFISRNECIFTSRCKILLDDGRIPLKGTVIWTQKGAEVSGRLLLGVTLSFLFWCFGWLLGGISGGIAAFVAGKTDMFMVGLMVGVTGFLSGVIIFILILRGEKKRMEVMINELKVILNSPSK